MDDFQELTYARFQSFPKGYTISIGDIGSITKEEALDHIKQNDDIGKIIINIDKNYFQALKSGALYESFNC